MEERSGKRGKGGHCQCTVKLDSIEPKDYKSLLKKNN
jgi:hypothetical protein